MKPTAVYKIFNKKSGRFMTGSKSKSSWSHEGWVVSYVNEAIRKGHKIDDIEIHVFPVQNAIIHSASDFVDSYKSVLDEKLKKKEDREKKLKLFYLNDHIRETERRLEILKKQREEINEQD
jgi:hypothetical protein